MFAEPKKKKKPSANKDCFGRIFCRILLKREGFPVADNVASKRQRSTIDFPYLDLEDSIAIARGIHEVGGSSCLIETLAGHLKQAPNGGGFRLRLICARHYGLVRYDKGEVSLNELGNRICDPVQEKGAKIEAFLSVPLYKALYDRFRNTVIPPPSGVESTMVSLGVATKQKEKARQTFLRSARQAGFFDYGNERLVMPSVKETIQISPQEVQQTTQDRMQQDPVASRYERHFHPFVEGLLQKLPPAEAEWSREERRKWLQTAANIFDLMYSAEAQERDTSIVVQIS